MCLALKLRSSLAYDGFGSKLGRVTYGGSAVEFQVLRYDRTEMADEWQANMENTEWYGQKFDLDSVFL